MPGSAPPKIAVWISFAGWAGLLASLALAVWTFFEAPRDPRAFAAALVWWPHLVGALLTIGAAEALALLSSIAAETARARAEADAAWHRIEKLLTDFRHSLPR
jgi:hypothetical protein